ncbi:MAG: hypothetical protein QY323_05755 [Patescibacteria group bacterium]|nr:MAG: hypothetical protein QY323_05755 [Patescibacteria group bacterium]
MSDPGSKRPLYRPVQPTPDQEEQIASLLDRLGTASDEPSASEIPADPAAPTAP